jgi:hypothetical protein
MSDMKPIKTLRLNRETVKRLGVRSSVRTGAAVNSIVEISVNGNSGSLARSGGLSKNGTIDCINLSAIGGDGGN